MAAQISAEFLSWIAWIALMLIVPDPRCREHSIPCIHVLACYISIRLMQNVYEEYFCESQSIREICKKNFSHEHFAIQYYNDNTIYIAIPIVHWCLQKWGSNRHTSSRFTTTGIERQFVHDLQMGNYPIVCY